MILRRLARPLLASIFISGGINALRQAEGHAEAAKPLLDSTVGRYADKLPEQVPTDPVTLVRVDAALKIAAGSLFALGKAPRLSALVLLGSLVPTTVAGHPFWAEKDEQAKQQQLIHFLKNAGLAGGLMLAAADTHGKPSLGWRAKKAAKVAGRQAQTWQKTAGKQAQSLQKTAGKQTRKARKRAKQLTS
ncbi:DoxX family protein [Amycolatopsis sp. 195334CR]|uniref:DoxX family protein n=1 Tax=Amycolatopsis sp. 195334CR TaxID=2814588 RepID=UPI001A905846|nr:DoxX family protein [Amycolatopsis sp. 195334CR]MBN6035731.1 DoxX family protein [Amycolatopsis sp. 195334CR]